MPPSRLLLALVGLVLACDAAALTPCQDPSGPRGAVMAYLRAMHEHRFDEAWDHVTPTMTDGLSREQWSAAQRALYLPGKVEIYGVDIRNAWGDGDDAGCHTRATVSNVLSSRDRLNAAGNVELEIYHVVNDSGTWRIDGQQTLFDEVEINRWFPAAGSYETNPD